MRRSLIALFCLQVLLVGVASANPVAKVAVHNAHNTSLTVASLSQQGQLLVISGDVSRARFGSRSPVRGLVVAEVIGADGEVLGRTTAATTPRFVARGLRGARFEIQVDQPIPAGSHVVLSFAS